MTVPRTGNVGGRTQRPNPWPRCLSATHGGPGPRVPPSAIHPPCQRAGDYGAFDAAAHTHGPPCCPGECPRCHKCLDRIKGLCERCGICLGCCPGHGKGNEDETGGQ